MPPTAAEFVHGTNELTGGPRYDALMRQGNLERLGEELEDFDAR